ncbi:hypothetical protein MH928_01840 [Flavobacterium sp. WW92]|jgi:hypothetical protein|uniref:hypothetical protein n=1 Tax=unclassified Flavobacterium TaxID=196869 RepID=UPI002225B115|nr:MULTISPECIES: hypothetical protein [unclassified Flavobacterium]WDO13453.1 hypothetical protein MH928_01840 [Flavobacterium sp. WW92]
MKKKIGIMLLAVAFFSCSKSMYTKQDYRLFEENFLLSPNTPLRTDGVYVLESVWNKDTGERKADEHIFYKFYNTGQANLTVDLDKTINTNQEYLESIKKHIASTNKGGFKTHLEGYYHLEGNKIIIERITVPRDVAVYSYGYVENGKLVIVTETIEGKGKLNDKYFTDFYKATYVFLPLEKSELENLKPGW